MIGPIHPYTRAPGRVPAELKAADAELAGLVAGDELARGSLEEAERFLGLAARGSASVPTGRGAQWQVLLGVVRLLLARQRGNLEAVAEEARRLQAVALAHRTGRPYLEFTGLAHQAAVEAFR